MTLRSVVVWSKIVGTVAPGQTVRNWSRDKGFTGKTFRVDEVDDSKIVVSGGRTLLPRRISKRDFDAVYDVWRQYTAGKVRRSEMIKLSRNTTYILSILHLVGDNVG